MEKKPFEPTQLRGKIAKDIFEKRATDHGLWVCGIDEAGRGPSAGPVVAAAAIVCLKRGGRGLLQDSKTLSPEQRAMAYEWLIRNSWFGVGIVNHRCIDEIGIYQANIVAMNRAFAQLCATCPLEPSIVLVDAVRLNLPPLSAYLPATVLPNDQENIFEHPWHKIIYFPHSERYSYSIAAASIIAKVTRDRIMTSLAPAFPCHKLEVHKGYHTPGHIQLINQHGPTIIHRASFLGKEKQDDESKEITMSLF
jgi:ribonuclease HII